MTADRPASSSLDGAPREDANHASVCPSCNALSWFRGECWNRNCSGSSVHKFDAASLKDEHVGPPEINEAIRAHTRAVVAECAKAEGFVDGPPWDWSVYTRDADNALKSRISTAIQEAEIRGGNAQAIQDEEAFASLQKNQITPEMARVLLDWAYSVSPVPAWTDEQCNLVTALWDIADSATPEDR